MSGSRQSATRWHLFALVVALCGLWSCGFILDGNAESKQPETLVENEFTQERPGTVSPQEQLGQETQIPGWPGTGCRDCGWIPSGLGPDFVDPAAGRKLATVDLNGGTSDDPWVIDTNTGAIYRENSEEVIRAPGPGEIDGIFFGEDSSSQVSLPARTFLLENFYLPEGQTLLGEGEHPLVLLVRNKTIIEGFVDLRATADRPGPGGYEGGEGGEGTAGSGPGGGGPGNPRTTSSTSDGGGAGGSFGGRGGEGAGAEASMRGVPAAPYGENTLVPLLGGSGGGSGSRPGGTGGHGGGAIQISSGQNLFVGPTALIDVSGSGGQGGRTASNYISGGGAGGGGSGGAILIEAPSIILEGLLGSAGGAGGQGAPHYFEAGKRGENGAANRIAKGPERDGDGGPGGDGSDFLGNGFAPREMVVHEGGGGGGSAGRIRINTKHVTASFRNHTNPGWDTPMVSLGALPYSSKKPDSSHHLR